LFDFLEWGKDSKRGNGDCHHLACLSEGKKKKRGTKGLSMTIPWGEGTKGQRRKLPEDLSPVSSLGRISGKETFRGGNA